jgi:hypothetical protein
MTKSDRSYRGPVPTIANMRFIGVEAVFVKCLNRECLRKPSRMTFEELRLADDTPFEEIAVAHGLRCRDCGDEVEARPDWQEGGANEVWSNDLRVGVQKSSSVVDEASG